jgi:F0F1-type ATP synthase assembly protein I
MNNLDKNLWWQPAIRIFLKMSGWVAGPVIISLMLGKYLDKRYNTEPWFFLGLTGIAFFVSIFGIMRLLIIYIKEIERNDKKE